MNKILFVEDNDKYRKLLSDELRKKGYEVDDLATPIKGMEMMSKKRYDLIISDLKLPIMSGIMFIESAKNINPKAATIILTGDPDETSELRSIDSNIDLYLEKSRSLKVILEYIEKLLQTSTENNPITLTSKSENIVIHTKQRKVFKDDEPVDLTPTEYEILQLLLKNKNLVLTREDFIEEIWNDENGKQDGRVIDSHIKKIRDKLASFSIMTVRGYGYKWNEYE